MQSSSMATNQKQESSAAVHGPSSLCTMPFITCCSLLQPSRPWARVSPTALVGRTVCVSLLLVVVNDLGYTNIDRCRLTTAHRRPHPHLTAKTCTPLNQRTLGHFLSRNWLLIWPAWQSPWHIPLACIDQHHDHEASKKASKTKLHSTERSNKQGADTPAHCAHKLWPQQTLGTTHGAAAC